MYNAHRFFSEMAIVQFYYLLHHSLQGYWIYSHRLPSASCVFGQLGLFLYFMIGVTGHTALRVYGADWALFLYL